MTCYECKENIKDADAIQCRVCKHYFCKDCINEENLCDECQFLVDHVKKS